MHGVFPMDRLEVLEAGGGPQDFLAEKLPVKDLTAAAVAGRLPPAVVRQQPSGNETPLPPDDSYDLIARVLYRRRFWRKCRKKSMPT